MNTYFINRGRDVLLLRETIQLKLLITFLLKERNGNFSIYDMFKYWIIIGVKSSQFKLILT